MQNSTNQPDRPRQRIAAVDTTNLQALKAFAAREGQTLVPAKDQQSQRVTGSLALAREGQTLVPAKDQQSQRVTGSLALARVVLAAAPKSIMTV